MIETDLYHISNEVKEKVHMLKKNNNKKSTVLYCFIETMYDIVAKILSRELSDLRYIKNI